VIDLTGSVLVRTRDHAPIAALCAERVGTEDRAQAAQLARLVSDLWHECGVVEGTGDPPVLIRNAWSDLVAKPIEDPGLKRPHATCYVDVLGGAEPRGVVP
jgi:hypothetical protein